jgi:tetratricopeptide (TPR) repeat protein
VEKMTRLIFLLIPILAFVLSYNSGAQTSAMKEELTKAQDLAKQGHTIEASKVLTEMMGKYPDSFEVVQNWLSINREKIPGEEAAIVELGNLEKTYPKNTAILFAKTFLQTENGHFDEALLNAEKLTTVQPEAALNWLMKGQILEFMNKNDEALNSYVKATSLDSNNADAWQNKAGILLKTNKFDEAIDSYNKAIQLVPGEPSFIYNRGCAYCRKGDKANALADLKKAISMNPSFKEYARKDEDFKSIWDYEDFKKLTSQ